jgi:4-hydroxy-tetrahydrodipicolinate reductase
MRALITGTGAMGHAIRSALEARGDEVVALLGRHTPSPADPAGLAPVDVTFEFSHASTLLAHVRLGLAAGCRAFVIGTTGWATAAETGVALRAALEAEDARAVVAPTFSLAAVIFGQLAEEAARRFGRFPAYDPYILEQHRRAKPDRPSGTAAALAERVLPYLPSKRQAHLADGSRAPDPDVLEVAALRTGSHPGMHVLGFDGPGEALELRISARDRSAYVAGALLAADGLLAGPARPGIHDFESLIRERIA